MSEAAIDQTSELRRMTNTKPVRSIAITSGKGGVGKSSLAVNIAVGMANMGHQVLLMDADLGLANIDILLGLRPEYNLEHVLNGERTLEEVIVEGPAGVKIIPAASGAQRMAELTHAENAGVIQAFSELNHPIDTLIVDTAAGLSDSVMAFTRAARDVIVVVCDEPASITDAYATIKVLNRDYKIDRFHVVANMARSMQQGHDLFAKLTHTTERFLDVTMNFIGVVPFDELLVKAVQKQKAVIEVYPRSLSGLAFKKIVKKIDSWPTPIHAGGHLEFFVERLIKFSVCGGAQ